MRIVWAGLLVAVFLPSASAQAPVDGCKESCRPTDPNPVASTSEDPTAPVYLYAHMQDRFTALLSTQWPAPDLDPPVDYSYLTPGLQTHTGTQADLNFERTTTLSPSSGLQITGGKAWTHMRAALPAELGRPLGTLFAYFYADVSPDGNQGSGYVPNLQAVATWEYFARDGPPVPIAGGVSKTFDMVPIPGQASVYEVKIPLVFATTNLPGNGDGRTQVSVSVHQVETAAVTAVQRDVRVRGGIDSPWRIILPVKAPLFTKTLETTPVPEGVQVSWSVNSVWGTYDVDAESIRMRVEGASGAVSYVTPFKVVDRMHDHDGVLAGVKAIWILNQSNLARLENLKLDVVARNLQGTYEILEPLDLGLPELQAKTVPGSSAFPGVFAVLAFMSWRGRLKTH